MRLREVIDQADSLKPNAFSNRQKTQWINEAEGKVQSEVLLFAPAEVRGYSYEADQDTQLLAAPPHDALYVSYLLAMIDFGNGEYDRYNNTSQLFNAQFRSFMRWFAHNYRPADKMEDFYE